MSNKILIFPNPDLTCTVRFSDFTIRNFDDIITAVDFVKEMTLPEEVVAVYDNTAQRMMEVRLMRKSRVLEPN